ncbi:MAG: hypothetical protein K0R12_1374 [Gammaproteobacteria bacterium]|jgi:hypothetical protein|nr:hypothetical protein [Gammaproteobacteria bacterium]
MENKPVKPIQSVLVDMFPDGRFNVENAARYLGLSPKTLATLRVNGQGPRFIKRGRIFYYLDDLDAWLNAHGRLCSTGQARAKQSSDKRPA